MKGKGEFYRNKTPIFQGIDGETAKDFCWIHGSAYIPPQYQRHMKCIAELEHVKSKEDAPWTSYYQWVTFVQLFQVGTVSCVSGPTLLGHSLHSRLDSLCCHPASGRHLKGGSSTLSAWRASPLSCLQRQLSKLKSRLKQVTFSSVNYPP